jgi:hypothetical protein
VNIRGVSDREECVGGGCVRGVTWSGGWAGVGGGCVGGSVRRARVGVGVGWASVGGVSIGVRRVGIGRASAGGVSGVGMWCCRGCYEGNIQDATSYR